MASALLATAAELGAAPEALVQAWAEVDRIAARVERRRRGGRDEARGGEVAALTAVVFDDLGFAREIDDDDPGFFLLPSVLAGRRGSCLGLGALYLMVAELIGLPLDGVRVPGHFFVRTRGSSRNVELLRRGEIMPDAWYRQKYGPWPEGGGRYFVPLSIEETSALFWFNAGNFARRHGDLARAGRAYERAAAEAPDFAEAHASLGLERQLEGALSEAERAYREAARTRADLPGLRHNRALLEEEERAAAGAHPLPEVRSSETNVPHPGDHPHVHSDEQ